MDECLSPLLHDCHAEASCINTIGSYHCTCNQGYDGNGDVCIDRDECIISPFFCHPRFECTNTQGGYVCACPGGFSGNGDYCYGMLRITAMVYVKDYYLYYIYLNSSFSMKSHINYVIKTADFHPLMNSNFNTLSHY